MSRFGSSEARELQSVPSLDLRVGSGAFPGLRLELSKTGKRRGLDLTGGLESSVFMWKRGKLGATVCSSLCSLDERFHGKMLLRCAGICRTVIHFGKTGGFGCSPNIWRPPCNN